MLCPSFASMREYMDWVRASGLDSIAGGDLTRRVEQTWVYCAALAREYTIPLKAQRVEAPHERSSPLCVCWLPMLDELRNFCFSPQAAVESALFYINSFLAA